MVYRDLLKVTIYFIAIKLFVDCISKIPGKIYESFLTGNWMINVLLYLCLNFLIIFLLLKFNNYLIEKIFSKEKNYLEGKENLQTIIGFSIIACSYYMILTNGFSLINNIFSFLKINFSVIEKSVSIIISLLLLKFSDKITKRLTPKNE